MGARIRASSSDKVAPTRCHRVRRVITILTLPNLIYFRPAPVNRVSSPPGGTLTISVRDRGLSFAPYCPRDRECEFPNVPSAMVSVHRPSPEHLRFFDTTEVAQNPGLAKVFCKPAIFAIRNIPATLWSIQLEGGHGIREELENIAQKDNGASENHRYPSLIQRFQTWKPSAPLPCLGKCHHATPPLRWAKPTTSVAACRCLQFEAQSDDLATTRSPTSPPPSLSTAEYSTVRSPRQHHPLLWKRGPRGARRLA